MRVVLYPYALWSEGSRRTVGRASFRAVSIVPVNWPLKLLRSKRSHRRLAQLPVVNPKLKCAARPSYAVLPVLHPVLKPTVTR